MSLYILILIKYFKLTNVLIFLKSKVQDQEFCHPISRINEEFTHYLENTGVISKVTAVLKLLYEMDEKPVDPLEYLYQNSYNHIYLFFTHKIANLG